MCGCPYLMLNRSRLPPCEYLAIRMRVAWAKLLQGVSSHHPNAPADSIGKLLQQGPGGTYGQRRRRMLCGPIARGSVLAGQIAWYPLAILEARIQGTDPATIESCDTAGCPSTRAMEYGRGVSRRLRRWWYCRPKPSTLDRQRSTTLICAQSLGSSRSGETIDAWPSPGSCVIWSHTASDPGVAPNGSLSDIHRFGGGGRTG
jgi:hypothetical protein